MSIFKDIVVFGNVVYNRDELKDKIKKELYEHNTEEYITSLINEFKYRLQGCNNPAIVCIGTKKVPFDAFGPLIYDAFRQLGVNPGRLYKFNGSDAEEVITDIKRNNHDIILAFDAELINGDKFKLMQLRFKDTPIHPGAGAGKIISPIGDICVTLPTGYSGDFRKVLIKTKNWDLYDYKDIRKLTIKFARIFIENVNSIYNFLD